MRSHPASVLHLGQERHQLRDISKVKTWLFTTLHREFLSGRRRQSRFAHHALEDVSNELPAVMPAPGDRLDSSHVLSSLARVDQGYQAAVALFYLKDTSYKEIADILEIPIGTVKSRIARGIAQLRQLFFADSPPASAPPTDGVSPKPVAAGAALPPKKPVRPVAPRGETEKEHESDYTQWDLSSTLLLEPIGLG
jgi:RNA polymerase sigma factor (sigma-70 family)